MLSLVFEDKVDQWNMKRNKQHGFLVTLQRQRNGERIVFSMNGAETTRYLDGINQFHLQNM